LDAAMPERVHVVSHGPHCLDGVAAAGAIARYYGTRATVVPHFASNDAIDGVLQGLALDDPDDAELWITDISWRDPATDARLRDLAARGVRLYWIDHHRTALERSAAGRVDVPFTESVLSERVAASRLVYEHLAERADAAPGFTSFRPVVAMADDNDRWLHQIPGSRELAWVVRVLGPDAYDDIVGLDERVAYTPRMQAARDRVEGEIARSVAVAEATRVERRVGDVILVAAMCNGHPSEIADRWGKSARRTVFALWDAMSLSVSLRRSPDCDVDLSHLAVALGGGGHAAAAGSQVPEIRRALAEALADRVGAALA
jgi:oligoribonuclease NrnB/cAMP/cGMP phosphodiesterase (DHH superfamily)